MGSTEAAPVATTPGTTPDRRRADASRTGRQGGTDRVLDRAVTVAVLAGFAGTPLVVVPAAADRYELPALVFLLACALVGGVAWWARRLLGAPSAKDPRDGGPRWLGAAVALLVAVVALATLASVSPATSIVGRHGRAGGLLTDVTVVAFGLLVVAWAHRRPRRLGLLATAGVASAGIGAAALLVETVTGGWPPPLLDPPGEPGLLGNANFSGAQVALGAPLLAAVLAGPARGRWRTAVVVVASLGALALWLSSTRGAILAAAAGVGVAGLVDRSLVRRWLVTASLVLALAGLVGTFAVAAADPALDRDVPVVGPLLDQRNLERRNAIWAGAWDVVWERPVLGHGPDTLALTFPPRTDPTLQLTPDPPDEAHDVVLDRATGAGVLGAAAFVLVVVLAGVHVRRVRSTCGPEARRWLAAFAGLLAGYVVQGLFSIDAVPLLLWGGTAVAAVATVRGAPREAVADAAPARRAAGPGRLVGVTTLVLLLGLGLLLSAGLLAADVEAGRSERAADDAAEAGATPAAAIDHASGAADLQPRNPAYPLLEAHAVLLAASRRPGTVDPATLRRGIAAADDALRLAPDDVDALEVAARLETLLAASTSDASGFARADRRWQQVDERMPADAEVRLHHAVALAAWSAVLGDDERDAVRARALEVTDQGEALVRARWAAGWVVAARLYDELGDPAAAAAARRELADRDVSPAAAEPHLAPLVVP